VVDHHPISRSRPHRVTQVNDASMIVGLAYCRVRLQTRVCGTGEAHVRPARVKHQL
jgi:hypothetical protein